MTIIVNIGYTLKCIRTRAANYPILQNLVPKKGLDIAI